MCEALTTPRRAQKRLFTTGNSSSKRNLFRDIRTASPSAPNSGDESDIGPMSPLALSDATPSSATNSPGRTFDSPLAAGPPMAPVSLRTSDSTLWEKGMQSEGQDRADVVPSSPFSVLKTVTRMARHSQRGKTSQGLSESYISVTNGDSNSKMPPSTPKRSDKNSDWNDGIAETPKRGFGREIQNESVFESDVIAETPQKDDSPIRRLITPLGSVSKEAQLPRLHHRKSLGNLVSYENTSPTDGKENMLKRIACPATVPTFMKLLKSDENASVPRARAALFQERKEEFKLSTKSFYGSPPMTLPTRGSPVHIEKTDARHSLKRRSISAKSNHGRSARKRKYGEINAGIGHGVKKPKAKRHISRAEAFKKEKLDILPSDSAPMQDHCEDLNVQSTFEDVNNSVTTEDVEIPLEGNFERAASPQVDNEKKFFKTNRTLTRNNPATVTVNDKIKLQVSNGKVKLKSQQRKRCLNTSKRAKGLDLMLDASDLTVDDPGFTAPINEANIDNILKVLEDDWADDEYDTMESLITKQGHAISPLKPSVVLNDVTMSPASELSNMTSVMNIKDANGPNAKSNQIPDDTYSNNVNQGTQFYPLFNKNFVRNNTSTELSKTTGRGIKRTAGWQMQTKMNKKDDRQYQLDFGQKRFGATECPECGVIYQIGDLDDERSHRNYHDSMKILKFPGWKHERVVGTDPYTSSRIILLEPGDPKHYWKKVSEVLAVVDRDLGLADSKLSNYLNDKIYLYVRDKEIIGVLVAEYATVGYQILPDLDGIDCYSSESFAIKCGIKVVWTTMSCRRHGVATKLMDTLRTNFYFGYILSVDDIAFSIPTPAGKAFAEKYIGTRYFKVYN